MRETAQHVGGQHQRVGARGVGVLAFMVLVWTGRGGLPPLEAVSAQSQSVADGLVGGMFLAGAALAAVVSWRRHQSTLGWTFAAGALVALQALLVALPAIASPPPRLAGDFALLLAIGLLGLVCVLGALRGLRHEPQVADDVFGVGIGMGILAAGHLLLLVPMTSPPPAPMLVLMALLVGTHVVTVAVVAAQRVQPAATVRLLVATVLVVASGLVVMIAELHDTVWDTLASLGFAAAGGFWAAAAWQCIQGASERQAAKHRQEIEFAVQATERDRRERMHELRSTLAGLVQGSSLLDDLDLPAETRQRLLGSVRRELDRMMRLLSGEEERPTDIDLEDALGQMADLQHLKGRTVELHTSGDAIHARYDSLAEVVNILVDNAATHGGTDTSRIDVVQHDDETVDITVSDRGRGIAADDRERIFGWGDRGADSPGEGIGLHLAQRLMEEEGGSLRLADDTGPGSSFVITLPAARRPLEDAFGARTAGHEEVDHVAGNRAR
jgi:signal transduction histidine kinase